MGQDSELKNYTSTGNNNNKNLEITSSSPHAYIKRLGLVQAYNGTNGDIEFTIKKASENSDGYKVVAKITIPVEGAKNLHGNWPFDDTNDKYKAEWSQDAGDVNITYIWHWEESA